MGVRETDPLSQLSLPPGFRFYPTDEELLVQYLCRKVAGHGFSLEIIGEIDLYKFDPWVLPSKAIFGEKEWYFFSPRDRKYPNGSRPNRVAGSGYWKATGTDKVITTEGRKVGIKKALVFYIGKAPKGTKTNWIMHEYRLIENSRKHGSSKLDDWVLCRIYKKNSNASKPVSNIPSKAHSNGSSSSSSSYLDDVMESLPEINDDGLESLPEIDDRFFALPRMNSLRVSQPDEKINFQNLGSGSFDWATLAGVTSMTDLVSGVQSHGQPPAVVNANCEMYVPSLPPLTQPKEEVQSGIRTQRIDSVMDLGFFHQNSNAFSQGFSNSLDPFGSRYPTQQSSGFGYRQ